MKIIKDVLQQVRRDHANVQRHLRFFRTKEGRALVARLNRITKSGEVKLWVDTISADVKVYLDVDSFKDKKLARVLEAIDPVVPLESMVCEDEATYGQRVFSAHYAYSPAPEREHKLYVCVRANLKNPDDSSKACRRVFKGTQRVVEEKPMYEMVCE